MVAMGDMIEVPGVREASAPAVDDHGRWTEWLCTTALPRVQPVRMPPQRFEYWSPRAAERVRALAEDATMMAGSTARETCRPPSAGGVAGHVAPGPPEASTPR